MPKEKTRRDPMQPAITSEPHAGKCGARLRGKPGKVCKHAAGFRTDHPGEGRCYLHGGRSPVKHGRYAMVKRPRIRELLEQFEQDPDPTNLLPELALLRSLIIDFVERYDEYREGLLRWNLSFSRDYRDALEHHAEVFGEHYAEYEELLSRLEKLPIEQFPDPLRFPATKPITIVDILSVGGYIAQIGGLVEKIRKARETQTFGMPVIDALWVQMSAHLTQSAKEVIPDHAQRQLLLTTVAQRWDTINLAELSRQRPPARDPEDDPE